MAARETLNSRLRVLVAKTFRAEKLYASMRNTYAVRPVNPTEVANDIRAREWQRVHAELRVALNDALSLKSTNALGSRIIALKRHFGSQAREASLVLEKGTERLVASVRRHEFAHSLKLSLEFVQHKARAQASQVVADELNDILQASGRADVRSGHSQAMERDNLVMEIESSQPDSKYKQVQGKARASNVIPFRRNLASGQ